MKFLKSLLLCFLFFGLGNLKAQKIDNETLKTNFLYKFHILLKNKYLEKGETLIIRNDKLISLREKYDERINLLGEKNSELFLENASSLNNFKVIYCAVLEKTLPDINAVFFNRGNVLSDEKITDEEMIHVGDDAPRKELVRMIMRFLWEDSASGYFLEQARLPGLEEDTAASST